MSNIEPDLPSGYTVILASLKELVASAQLRAQQAAISAMVEMYWAIGATILARQTQEPWGSKVLHRLAADLKTAFPHMRGFSRSNLFYMRAFAAAWDWSEAPVRSRVGALPWGHIIELLKLKDPAVRDWYAQQAVEQNWKLQVLEHQIATGLHRRLGSAPNNLEARLPSDGAELAQNVAKDPLVLDFLGLTTEAEEMAIEEAMTQRMSQTLAEFGRGFAFYGRQYHLDVEGEDFYIDLLLVHVPTNRFVVVELKSGKFRPEHLGYAQRGITPANSTSTSLSLTMYSAANTITKRSASSSAAPKTIGASAAAPPLHVTHRGRRRHLPGFTITARRAQRAVWQSGDGPKRQSESETGAGTSLAVVAAQLASSFRRSSLAEPGSAV